MKNFRDLQKKHEILLKSKQGGEDITKEVESYIEVTINAGQDIINSFQREQLRANNRYWGNYIYEKTGTFPKTDIDPPSDKIISRQRAITWSIRGMALIITILLIANLVLFSFPEVFTPTHEVIVTLSPICTPEAPLVNVYRAAPQPWANAIFEVAFPSYIPTPVPPNPVQINEQQLLNARYAAFQQLVFETKRWSGTQTVKLDDSNAVSIIVTYISPELLQAVFLNQVLKDRSITYGFQDQLQKTLNAIAAREELLFLLTLTTNNTLDTTRHTIKIPIQSMFMNNAENLTIAPSHDDHNLDLLIDTSAGPVYGYIAYPLAQVSASQCKWILDPKDNINSIITVPYIEVDDVSNKTPVSWTIPYAPLISPVMPTNTPVSILPLGYDPNLYPMTPLALPPSDINQQNYWRDFARFVWGQISPGNY